MLECEAKNCSNSTDCSLNDYCPYHEGCLDKLQRYENIYSIEVEEMETFETWFNKNCGYVIILDCSASSSYPYSILIVVFEPVARSMGERLVAIKYKCGYSGISGASSKARRIKNKLQNGSWYDTPMLKVHP